MDPPMVPFAAGGTVAWLIAGLVLLPQRGSLAAHGHTWWLWMCLAGVLFGLLGWALMARRDRRRRARRAARGGGYSA